MATDHPSLGPTASSDGSTQQPIRLLLVDDHQILRESIRSLFETIEHVEVVGEAADGAEAVVRAEALRPDVVLMDVNMPVMGGIEATRIITGRLQGISVVALSMHDDPHIITKMHVAGASAFATKSDPVEKLVETIRLVVGGADGPDGGASTPVRGV